MKTPVLCLLLVLSFIFFPFQKDNEMKVAASFDMPSSRVSDFSKCRKMPFTVFRAVQEDKEKTTTAIAREFYKSRVSSTYTRTSMTSAMAVYGLRYIS